MSVDVAIDFKLESLPENLFREPVEYIFADHFRQRMYLAHLDDITAMQAGALRREEANQALHFLRSEMIWHLEDEEQDLFPLLRSRCKPEDDIDAALNLLSMEHERDANLAEIIIAGLEKISAGKSLTNKDEFSRAQAAFAEAHRRHLAWENGVVLPLARRRLSTADMADLGRSMAARRKIDYPE